MTKHNFFDIIYKVSFIVTLFLQSDIGGKCLAQIILVTSFKGGVGKTTISANLAITLAKNGKKVLACDCDLESRCLDLVLGIENQPLFNICDVVCGRCSHENATVCDERYGKLYFMPAPAFYPEAVQIDNTSDIFGEEAIRNFLQAISSEYDYVIFDLPARPDMLYRRLIRHADRVLVVCLHTATSIRAAEKTAIAITELADENRQPETSLIVNGFKASDVKKGEKPGLYEIINKAGLPLLGVIPFDAEMVRAQEMNIAVCDHRDGMLPFWRAVRNIARRFEGKNIPLLEGVRTGVKKQDLY